MRFSQNCETPIVIPSEVEEFRVSNIRRDVPTSLDMTKIRNFIDGQFVEPVGGKYLDNIEPATGKPYSQVADSDARDVELAVSRRGEGFRRLGRALRPPNGRAFFCASPI